MFRSLAVLTVTSLSCADTQATPCSFSDARLQFSELLADQGLPGGGFLVGTAQGILAESYYGNYTAATVVPIASASKLLSAVRVLQVTDRGQAGLDAPVSTYLPTFTGEKGTMTLRQMFSHISGYGNDSGSPVIVDDSMTLAQSVNMIACCRPLNTGYTGGGQFSYSGLSMQIGGRVAEVVGDGDCEQRWKSDIGTPLGITTIDWQGLGATSNYGIAGSAQSNLRDYGRFLQMIVNGGRGNNQRLLRASTPAVLEQDNIGDLPVAYAPPHATPPVRYGLGSWLDAEAGQPSPTFLHSVGALGYFPWFDFERRVYGVFMIRAPGGGNDVALPVYQAMVASNGAEIDGAACTPVEFSVAIFASEFDRY